MNDARPRARTSGARWGAARGATFLLLVACGDAVVAGGTEVSETVGPSLGRTPGVTVTEPCASAAVGAACTNAPDECELGDSASFACNARIACNGFRWVRVASAADCGSACPESAVAGTADGLCEYEHERQTCARVAAAADAGAAGNADGEEAGIDAGGGDAGSDAGEGEDDASTPRDADAGADGGPDAAMGDAEAAAGAIWTCIAAPPGCPRVRPHAGLRCVVPMTCDYGACLFPGGRAMECVGEFWHVAETGCPR